MNRVRQSLIALRIVTATLLFIHGTFRLANGGVSGFGEFLNGQHIPLGLVVAWIITLVEICGTPFVAFGKFVRPLALWYAAELSVGILLVHLPEGWFVVGGGRNGMEYSVLMVASFLAQAWAAPDLAGEAA